MSKIAVVGDRESVLGFKAVGLDVFGIDSPDEARGKLQQCAEADYAIIYITEGMAKHIPEEIEKYKETRLPAIIPIPGMDGSYGIGMANVKKSVEQAVGADILFDKE